MRELDLYKPPGVAETIDWARALAELGEQELTEADVEHTLGWVLKYREDIQKQRPQELTPSCGRRPPTVSDGADRLAVIFARRLRAEGMTVPTGSVALFVEALDAVDPLDGDHVYWAARVILVKRPEDIDAFDRAFASFWLGRTGNSAPTAVAADERIGVDCTEPTADTLTAEPPSMPPPQSFGTAR